MYEYKIKVLRIVDGDTVDVMVDLGFDVWTKQRLRLSGIDAPEIRTRDLEEKKRGYKSKQALKSMLGSNDLVITSDEKGKYGRYLATIYDKERNLNINEEMVANGYAEVYNA